MKITVNSNRTIEKSYEYNEGSQFENNVSVCSLEFPEEYNDFGKRIVFITEDGNFWDYIVGNEYIFKNNVTKYKRVAAYFLLTNGEQEKDFRSKVFEINFNPNEQANDIVPEPEQIDVFTKMINDLTENIHNVEELELQVQQLIDDYDDTIERINNHYEEKTNEFDEHVDNKTIEFNDNADNLTHEIENTGDLKTKEINDTADTKKEEIEAINNRLEPRIQNLELNKADRDEIPEVSQFITNAVDDLINYYTKNDTFTKTEVQRLIESVKSVEIKVVDSLPTVGETNIIYFVPKQSTTEDDIYNEYVYVNNRYEFIGSTAVELTGYAKEEWVNTQIKDFLTETQINNLIVNALKDYALKSEIPTNTSELVNDSGFLTEHQNITGKEDKTNKVTEISSSSNNTQYPSAKAVYDYINSLNSEGVDY